MVDHGALTLLGPKHQLTTRFIRLTTDIVPSCDINAD